MDQALKNLEDFGVAVIPNVISSAACNEEISKIKCWLQKFEPGFPNSFESGIIANYGIGHSPASWSCRLRIKHIFAEIYGTDKLLTSFDGMSIVDPKRNESPLHFSDDELSYDLLHLDQGPHRVGLHSYQGALYLEGAQKEDFCFKVIAKSHQFHAEFFEEFPPLSKAEFREVERIEVDWYLQKGCSIQRIAVPKGGLVLWDSRTVHAGAAPLKTRAVPKWRFTIFICMVPAKWATEQDLEKKKKGYANLLSSSHWPANGARVWEHEFKPEGKSLAQMPVIACTDEAKKLAGVIPYEFTDDEEPDWSPQYTDKFSHMK